MSVEGIVFPSVRRCIRVRLFHGSNATPASKLFFFPFRRQQKGDTQRIHFQVVTCLDRRRIMSRLTLQLQSEDAPVERLDSNRD